MKAMNPPILKIFLENVINIVGIQHAAVLSICIMDTKDLLVLIKQYSHPLLVDVTL